MEKQQSTLNSLLFQSFFSLATMDATTTIDNNKVIPQGTCSRRFNDYVSCIEKDGSDKSGAGISMGESVQFMVAAAKAANTKLSLEIQQQQMKLHAQM
jgi:hypothetical protein